MDRFYESSRDVQENYRKQSPYLRKSRWLEGGGETDKPTTLAQSSDDFATSAMKSIFVENCRVPYEYPDFRNHHSPSQGYYASINSDMENTSEEAHSDHDSSSQSYYNYFTQLAAGVMRWIFGRESNPSGHGDYDNQDTHLNFNQEYFHDSDFQNINADIQYETTYNNIPRSASHASPVEFSDHLDIQHDVIQNKRNDRNDERSRIDRNDEKIRNDLKNLFSDDKIQKETAEQKVVTRLYLEKWEKEEQRPKSEEFNDAYRHAHNILENPNIQLKDLLRTFNLTDWKSQNQNLLRILRRINQKFRAFAPQDIFQQEKDTARELIEWAETFKKHFDLREKWVQAGIKQQLGIDLRYLDESHWNLKGYLKLDYPSPATDEKLVVAYEKLKAIHELLEDGIPVESRPKRISGRDVINVSGEENNCLIRALLIGAKPNKWEGDRGKHLLETIATEMREQLIAAGLTKKGDLLDLAKEDGGQLIKNIKEAGLMEKDRNVLAYRYKEGKIQYYQITYHESNKSYNKLPYAVLLHEKHKHFYAIKMPY